jgi:hypothetical protein
MDRTPGPWEVSGESGNRGEAEVIENATRVVAWTANTYNDETDEECVTDEDRANARLIAAAPDLLAACEAAMAVIVRPWPKSEELEAHRILLAAIAKATT